MRVLQVHNYYQLAGGEDEVVRGEGTILRDGGWQVDLWSVDNAEITSPIAKAKVALGSSYSMSSRVAMDRKIALTKPDLVHVHNFFPLLTPSIYDACLDAGVPIVQTLHNYRTICPGGFLFREGNICTDCVGASPFQAVSHKCYRGSRIGTLAVARMAKKFQKTSLQKNKVNKFIALSDFAKKWFVAGGFPADRIAVKHNFTIDLGIPIHPVERGNNALFVGRLSPEKGVGTMLEAWRDLDIPLRIAGEGPLKEKLEQQSGDNVQFLGQLSRQQLISELRHAMFLVVPSEWYEGPLTIMEAFACGLPVICSDLGAMQEMVEEGQTGLRFTAGDSKALASRVHWAVENRSEMASLGANARKVYERVYTPEANFKMLTAIYNDVLGSDGGEK